MAYDAECIHCETIFASFGLVPLCPRCTRMHARFLKNEDCVVSIDLGKSEAMATPDDVGQALRKVANRLLEGELQGNVQDRHGAVVGRWEMRE